jgi:hypothetical protein
MRTKLQQIIVAMLLMCVSLAAQTSRISEQVDSNRMARVHSPRHAAMFAQYDEGQVSATKQLRQMQAVLRPSAVQRIALEQLIAEQQRPGSANYHKWLTPEQYADRFGVSQADANAVVAWLQANGMTNIQVSRGRTFVGFSGNAASVSKAFRTEIHSYNVNGERHFANVTAPAIPSTLAGIVSGIAGLHDFTPKPSAIRSNMMTPQYTMSGGTNFLGPDDLATIYNMKALYAQGVDGRGVTVAVLGETPITLDDYRAYRQMFNLPVNDFKIVVVPGSTTGTNFEADRQEATLDVEVIGAVARNATILYVWGGNVILAAQYVVDNQVAQVMSLSYAGCESPEDSEYYEGIALQASAEGITWISAAGDSGAAGCDLQGSSVARHGLSVMAPANLPEVTGVGGTTFIDGQSSQYWNPSNNGQGGTAKTYVPESVWNGNDSGMTVTGSGGGISKTFPKPGYQASFDTEHTSGRMVPDVSFYSSSSPTPYVVTYQNSNWYFAGTSAATPLFAGITTLLNHYLMANGHLSQAGLGNVNPTLYLLADKIPSVFHDVTNGDNVVACEVGSPDCSTTGTMGYSATPGYDEATGLGSVDAYNLAANWMNVNFEYASISLRANAANTQASQTVTFTASVTTQGGSVPSGPITLYFTNPSSQTFLGQLSSGVADQSGIATITTDELPSGTNTITATYGGSTTIAGGSSSQAVTVNVTAFPTSTVLVANSEKLHTGSTATFNVSVSAPQGVALGGPDKTDVHYFPGVVYLYSADGTLQVVAQLPDGGTATVTSKALKAGANQFYASYSGNFFGAKSQSSPVTVNVTDGIGTATTLTASSTQIDAGDKLTLTAKVAQATGATIPNGTVTFYSGNVVLMDAPLVSGVARITIDSLPVGTAVISATYAGNDEFNASTSNEASVTVKQPSTVPTTITVTVDKAQLNEGDWITITAAVKANTSALIPTGSIDVLANGKSIMGAITGGWRQPAVVKTTTLAAGTNVITAVFTGTSGYVSSISAPVSVTVAEVKKADFTITAPSSLAIAVGSSASFNLSIAPQNGFNQAIRLSCTGLAAGSSCNLPSSITPQSATTVMVTIATVRAALVAGMPFALFGMMIPAAWSRRKKIAAYVVLATLMAVTVGCGGGKLASTSTPTTQPQSSVVTITATSGSISHQVSVTVTVNQ